MKQRSKSFLVFFLILSMVLQTVGASFVHAAGEVKPDVTITDFSIVDQKGEYGGYERFKLALKWDATHYKNTLKEGDYFDVTLPENMVFPTASSATHFPLLDSEGKVVANAVVSPNPNGGGKVRATFTSYVNGRYNVKGTMFLEANFSQDKLKYGQVNKFKVVVGKTTKEINVKIKGPVGKPTEQLGKWAEEIPGKDDQIKWSLRVNFSSGNLTNLKIEDKLLSNETIIDGSFKVHSIHWNDLGHYKGSKELTGAIIKLAPDKKSFTVDLSNVKPYIPSGFDANGNVTGWKLSGRPAGDLTGAQVYITYKTTYTPGTKVGNNAKGFSPSWKTPKDVTFEYKSASSGGTGEGNKGKVKIVKVDAINPNIKLPQAKFEIRIKNTNELIETMITGDNGEAISKTTLDPTKKYILKEISTPPGYQVESTSENLEFTPDLNKLTTVDVKNKRILTSVSGEKTWVNDDGYNVRPAQVTIQLVADGKDVEGKSLTVKPDQNGHWKYEFKDLPKFRTDKRDEKGNDIPIVYTVREVKVPEGYTSEVSGMNVKNTFTPKEYDFKFRKTDVAGTELAGAKIKLSSDDGRATIKENGVKVPSVEWISDGTAKQLTLEPGNYTFVETAAPEGFSLATTIKFTVNKDGSVSGTTVKVDGSTTIISMVDDYKYHDVKVSKIDLGGTELAGAKITVKSADGSELISNNGTRVSSVTWVSTNTPKELKLRAGKYIFHEESAPEGYLTVTDIEFEVDKDGNVKVTKVAEDDIVKSEGGKITITDRKEISIKTEAKVNGEKEVKAKGQLTLTDKVSYKNLIVGKTYTVNLVWMDKETNQPFLAEGNPIKAETTFVAQQADGEVELNVTVDSNYFTKETKLVAFEEMFQNGVKVAAHEDINDEAQSVVIKENFNPVKVSKVDLGGTELAGAKITVKSADGTNLINDNGTKVNTISWESTDTAKELNLLPGKYVFHEEAAPEGYLTVTDIEFEVDKDGNVKVTKVAEDDIVKSEGGKVTITDRKKPTVETEAKVNGEKEDAPTNKVVLTDVVKYKNLIVGKTYKAKLVWMDKETNKPFLVDGKEVTAEKEFVAEQENGEIELSVTLDAKNFEKDTQLVAFEEVYKDNVLVAAHKDINDENQTVKVKQPKPDLKTEAKVNGEKEVKAKDELTLTDKVSYKNLVIGKTYTTKLVWMDKETGKPFLVDGKELTAEKTFVAEQENGELELTLTVDSKYFTKDTTLVAFEKMFENNVEVAAHEDINDVDQSVVVRENFNPVKVSKVDLGGTELAGAKITVKSADGTNLINDNGTKVNTISWESTDTAKELNLLPGKYVFHEEAAPEGYLTVTDIEFEVDKDGNVKVTKVAEDDIVKSEGGKVTITDRKEISIKTEAKVNGEKEVKAKGQLTLTDKVSYKNLIVGKTYTVNLVWMDKETNQPFLAEGNPIKAETTFVAQQADGEVELNVTVDSNYFTKETKLVAFEEMFQNGVKVAAHEDINDEAQSVVIKENFNPVKVSKVDLGGTELAGAKITVKSADGTNLINDNGTKVNTISWESADTAKELNLLPGKYVFHEEAAPEGYLTVTDIEFEVDKDGNVKVTKVAEDDIVKSEGGKVTITDRKKPTVETEAKVNGEKEDAPTNKVVLTDVVKYKNLIVGKTYKAKLVWMDKETGKPFLVDGKEVTAEKEFVAEQENGEIELSVTLDAKNFEKDTQLVAFEEVYKDNVLVAAHKDINDENQTVKVKQPKPDLKTEAKVNGEKEVKAKDELTLTDKVSYKNLVIGKTYTTKLVWMDKETGKPFLADGKELTAEKTFVAEQENGELELTLTVDSKYFTKDTTLVAFEKMFENNVEVAAHEDINDVDQSVVVRENFNPVKVSKVDLGGTELAGAKITVKSADGTNLINDNGTKVNTISWESTDTAKELNLLPGKYVFHEEAAPEGYLTVTDIEFEVDKDGNVKVTKVAEDDIVKSEGGKVTITDRKKPTVETEAKVNGEKEDAPTNKVVLTDVVKYKNLIVGKTYKAKLVWMDKETGKPFLVDGKEVTAEKEFVAEQENGEIELSVTLDAKNFEKDTQLVAFEEVYKDNVLVAAHKDINDENQTVKVKQPKPDLKTEAKVNGEKEVKAKDELTLTDKVSYKNLVIGKEYTVKLVWMDKETNKPFLADRKELTAEKTFVAEASEGEIELSVNVDSKYFEKDTTLVAFEKLFENNVEIGSHEDINDVDQSVVVRENFNPVKVSKVDLGGTELAGAKITVKSADGTNLINDNGKKVNSISWESTDTAKELNLLPGKYVFHEEAAPEGYLTVTDIEFEVDKDGNVKVTKVAEDDIVKSEGGKVTITDRKKPTVETEAKVNGEKEDAPTDKVVLTDVVKYKNLIVGKTYKAKLVWMDKETGKPFLVDGKEVTAEKEFVAEQENGEIELSVTVDAKHFEKDTQLVAFEEVYKDNVLVAAHKDIDDENQTVRVNQPKSKLKTEAKVNGKKEAVLEQSLTLTDYVHYTNLVVGKEYTVKLVWMDKATGKELLVNGKPLTVEKTFVAEKSNGTIELSTVVEAKYLTQGKLVAFETMYEKGKEIASHRDINDADQTILLKKPRLPKTNIGSNLTAYVNMLLGSGALVALLDSKRRKRSK